MSLRTGGKGHVTPIHTLPHHVILGESNTRVCSGIAWIYLGILGYSRVFLGIFGYSWVFLGILDSRVFSGILGIFGYCLGIARLCSSMARVLLSWFSITDCKPGVPFPMLSHTHNPNCGIKDARFQTWLSHHDGPMDWRTNKAYYTVACPQIKKSLLD